MLFLAACTVAATVASYPQLARPAVRAHKSGELLRSLRGGQGLNQRGGLERDEIREPTTIDDDEPEAAPPPKVLAHALVVEEALDSDSSVCSVHPDKAEELGLLAGDIIRLKGKRDRETLCFLKEDEEVPVGSIFITSETRGNLHVTLGDTIKIYRCDNVKPGTQVTLSPLDDAMAGLSCEELLEQVVKPHFEQERPLCRDNKIRLQHGSQMVEFKVVELEPSYRCLAGSTTEFEVSDPIERSADAADEALEGYDSIGGCDKQLAKIRELVELPMRHPKVFTSVGVRPPRGVLIHGPPGCGKTMIAKAVAAETGAHFTLINGPEIMSKAAGESESNLRKAFEDAEREAPAIIFIDELDAIAPRRDKTQGEVERRIVSQLITLMDGLKPKSQVVLMAATNRPNTIEPALRRFGRFDLELNIPVPDEAGRLDILRIKTRDMRMSPDVDLKAVAADSQGYCGADLAQTIFEAAMLCVREQLPSLDLEADKLPQQTLDKLIISPDHVREALRLTNPSTLRETAIEVPNISWEDIGGLEDVKRELRELVQYPVQYAAKFEQFGMNPSKGVLFYGPPGCGKTLLAKAVASECKANFISVKGPELLTQWFGESEANVRELFDKARQASPCVIFFDEMDSIAKARGAGGGGASEAGDRVINQILTEIDGVGARKSVFVIGATNRPDILDPAIMRPGRLDQLIYIPVPDYESRLSIFRACLRKSPLADDVDLEHMANITEDFSGADITEICQRACKLAIREEIDEQEAAEAAAEKAGKPLPEPKTDGKLSSRHFEASMKTARRSVSKAELARYLKFRKDLSVSQGNAAAALKEAPKDTPKAAPTAKAPAPAQATASSSPPAVPSGDAEEEDDVDDDELYG